jgi:hypothetical protein
VLARHSVSSVRCSRLQTFLTRQLPRKHYSRPLIINISRNNASDACAKGVYVIQGHAKPQENRTLCYEYLPSADVKHVQHITFKLNYSGYIMQNITHRMRFS